MPEAPEPRRGLLGVVGGLVLAGCAWAGVQVLTRPPVPPPLDALPTVAVDPMRPLNVVLVVGCTLRADQVAGWRDEAAWTPFLAELGEQGARVRHAISTAPWTKPALTSILSGRHAVHLGLAEPTQKRNSRRVPDEVELLAERFAAHGYATGGFVANTNASQRFGLGQGFEHYAQPEGLWRDSVDKIEGWSLVDDALTWVAGERSAEAPRPVFVELVMVDGHLPDTTTQGEKLTWTRPDLPHRVAAYRARLARFDKAMERLHDGLAQMGMDRSNTLLLLVGDHGEGLKYPEHHGKGHGNYFYESTVRVPLLATGPDIAAGHWVEGLVSHVDVGTTVLELAGLPAALGEGRSFASALTGKTSQTDRQRAFTQTWFGTSERSGFYELERICVEDFDPDATDLTAKRVARRYGTRPPAFPTGCYAREEGDFGPLQQDEAAMQELRAWHATGRAVVQQGPQAPEADIDEVTNAQLEALGYLEGGDGEGVPEQ